MIDKILELVKRAVKDVDDDLLSLRIEMAIQSILNYCNINVLPEALIYVVANMVISEIGEAPVSSVSEGGRSVSFDGGMVQAKFDDSVKNIEQLNRYRQAYRLD